MENKLNDKELYNTLKQYPRGIMLEIAENCGVHRNTVTNILRKGIIGTSTAKVVASALEIIEKKKAEEKAILEQKKTALREELNRLENS